MMIQMEATEYGIKVTFDLNDTEYNALQKALALVAKSPDLSLTEPEIKAVQQISRNLNRIKLG